MNDSNVKPTNKSAQKWLQRLLESPHALVILFFMSALEATLIPIPLELVLIPFMILERERIWSIASVALAGCLFGAVCGYYIGYTLFDTAGQWFINYLNLQDYYQEFKKTLESDGFIAIFLVGVTPVPFQTAMLAAGATAFSLPLFLLASGLSRGIRYYGLAVLALWLGPYAQEWWQKNASRLGWSIAIISAIALLIFQFS
ncbi:membrane protein YqaA with SNARE-associated domain [Idiomarina aquatica]|uniref:Membrane protein YqaA with SNARE-associated domain n=1 Tax=Idiomarina aquatica TaxID=1327752 RepID=A0A4R6PIL8_9GAMM|nr:MULTISPECIES: VTT domain-containing protein [Idiomarina]TDP37576.1 membrane protein YqaA with SNARE-associated domain [Idiomarina aquatica]